MYKVMGSIIRCNDTKYFIWTDALLYIVLIIEYIEVFFILSSSYISKTNRYKLFIFIVLYREMI